MWGYSGNVHLPTPHLDKKQDVIGHQPTLRPDFSGKEICGGQDIPVRANKLAPGRGLFSFWDWAKVMSLQDIADRLVAHRIPHILQRPDNAILTPTFDSLW